MIKRITTACVSFALAILVYFLLPVECPEPAKRAAAIFVAVASSFNLALPVSTPPMAMAYGTGEITVRDMLKAGIIFTIAANVLLLLGFQFGIRPPSALS